MNKKITLLLLLFSCSLHLHGSVLIQGDPSALPGETFSFFVGNTIFSSNGNFYEGSNQTLVANQQFALSRLARGTTAFVPLASEFVMLDSVTNAPNPLFGQQIIALGMLQAEDRFAMRDVPVVVGANDPAKVYILETSATPESITMASSVLPVVDANKNVSNGVVNLTTNNLSHVFAAVKPNGGQFGSAGGGIAMLVRGTVDIPTGQTSATYQIFSQVNASDGSVNMPQALELDPASPSLFITTPLANIVPNQTVMHWSPSLKSLYVGLQVTANSGATDGARSIALIRFNSDNGGINAQPMAPDTAFTSGLTTTIIGTIGANAQVSVNALSSMFTSTGLNYLIVVGGVGTPASTEQTVYALPLVNTGNSIGTIAQKTAQPVDIFSSATIPNLIARSISTPATVPADMTLATDVAAQIGGGQLTAGPIVNIIVRDDTVFALVGQTNPGVYSSQAIFDAAGKIISWTTWQRAAGTTNNIFGAALNAFDGTFVLASGTSAATVNTINQTNWSDGNANGLEPLTAILDATLPATNGGIQGLATFLPNSPGVQNISFLAAGGISSIILAQTGTLNLANIIIPVAGASFNDTVTFTNGTITSNVNHNTVIISGGALTTVGPITAFEVGVNLAHNGWLFVGGSKGLAVLTQPNGAGWNSTTQLGTNFNGLQTGMQFNIIGNYTFVKKLIYDSNFLYVITDSTVDRINLSTSNFGTNTLDVTTLATNDATNGVASQGGFLDGIFSQALGIIATTDELLRIGNNKDVRTVTSQADAQWQPITIPENAGAPTALYAVAQSSRAQDITTGTGGHFYTLTASAGLDQSRINRFAVQPLSPVDTVQATTITAFDDLFVKNIPSFLLSFGEFRSNFATDGALYFATRNQNNTIPPVALLTPSFPEPRVGVSGVGDRSVPLQIAISGTEINGFQRSQASGSWIIAGNFNTQVLE
jgi:hypothetical protein